MKPTDILMLWDTGYIDNDKLMLLLSEEKELPYHLKYNRFELDSLDDLQCRKLFCFAKDDLPILVSKLRLRDEYRSPSRVTWSGLEGLCLML